MLLLIGLATACVSPRKFADLQEENQHLKQRIDSFETALKEATASVATLEETLRTVKDDLAQKDINIIKLQKDTALVQSSYRKLVMLYDDLNDTYERLISQNKNLTTENEKRTQQLAAELQKLQTELQDKEKALTQQEAELKQKNLSQEKLTKDLEEREKRVNELELLIYQKDSALSALKSSVSEALYAFRNEGLSVTEKDGKLYVSLEEKLLFPSGRYTVDARGREALLKLAEVLRDKQEITVMVEGHTDDVPISTATIQDNWDLSVLRATSVSRILTGPGKIDPERVIASGRSEYLPVEKAKTPEARKKNRRIEVILTPRLDKLYQLINN